MAASTESSASFVGTVCGVIAKFSPFLSSYSDVSLPSLLLEIFSSLIRLHPRELVAYVACSHVSVQFRSFLFNVF